MLHWLHISDHGPYTPFNRIKGIKLHLIKESIFLQSETCASVSHMYISIECSLSEWGWNPLPLRTVYGLMLSYLTLYVNTLYFLIEVVLFLSKTSCLRTTNRIFAYCVPSKNTEYCVPIINILLLILYWRLLVLLMGRTKQLHPWCKKMCTGNIYFNFSIDMQNAILKQTHPLYKDCN